MVFNEETFINSMNTAVPSIRITRSDLRQLTSSFVINLYRELLNACYLDSEKHSVNEGQDAYLQSFHGEILGHHPSTYNLFKTLDFMFKRLLLPETFTYTDLLTPEETPLRTFKFLSVLLNFVLFQISLEGELHDDIQEVEDRKDYLKGLEQDTNKLRQLYRERKEKEIKYDEDMKEMKHKVKVFTEKRERMEESLKSTYEVREESKQVLLKGETKIKYLEGEMDKLNNDLTKIHSQMVQSPQQIVDSYDKELKFKEELQQTVKNKENDVQSKTTERKYLDEVINMYKSVQSTVDKFRSLQKHNEKGRSNSATSGDLSKLHSEIKQTESETPPLKEEIEKLNMKQHGIVVKIKEVQRQIKSLVSEKMEEDQKVTQKLAVQENEMKQFRKEAIDNEGRYQHLKESITHLNKLNQEKFDAYMKELEDQFRIATDLVTSM